MALLWWVLDRFGSGIVGQLFAAPWVLLAFTAQAAAGGMVEAQRLRLLLRAQEVDLAFGPALRIILVAFFFSMFVPGGTGGDLMKLWSLSRANAGRAVEMAATLLVDRVMGLSALLAVAVGAALLTGIAFGGPASARTLAAGAAAALAAIALVVAVATSGWMARTLSGRPAGGRLTRLPLRVLAAFSAFHHHRGALAAAFALSVANQLVLVSAFILSARVLVPAAPTGLVAVLSLLGIVANALPVTPGGLGVGEAALEGIFQLSGYSGGAGLLVSWRIGLLPVALLGGVLYTIGERPVRAAEGA